MWQQELTAFLATSVLDILSTCVALEGGLAESNALPALILESGGAELMLFLKGLTVLLIVAFILRVTPFFPRLWRGLRVSNWILGVIVLSNTVQSMLS